MPVQERTGCKIGHREKGDCDVGQAGPLSSDRVYLKKAMSLSTPYWDDMDGSLCPSCLAQPPATVCPWKSVALYEATPAAGGCLSFSLPMPRAPSPSLKGDLGGTSLCLPWVGGYTPSATILTASKL